MSLQNFMSIHQIVAEICLDQSGGPTDRLCHPQSQATSSQHNKDITLTDVFGTTNEWD